MYRQEERNVYFFDAYAKSKDRPALTDIICKQCTVCQQSSDSPITTIMSTPSVIHLRASRVLMWNTFGGSMLEVKTSAKVVSL